MSLSPELHCEDSTTALDNTTALSLYTTAYESSEKNIVGEETKEIMDDSFNSTRDDLCLTALEDSFGDSDVPKDLPVSQQHDDLDDCIAAFGGLAIANKPSPKKQDTLDIPGKTALNDKNLFNGDLYRRLSDGSSFCVIDWDADGQPVEHTLRYLPKPDSANKASTSLLSNIEKDSQTANNDYVAVTSAKGDDHFVQTTVIPHNEEENISKSQEVSSAQSCSEIQSSSSSLQSVGKPAGESTTLPNSLPESSAIAIPHIEPVEPSTSDSNTASNSESYVNAMSLPNIGSSATSRDNTPFLTPEADMSFSDFDPLVKEIRTPVKVIALSAGICKEVEGDIDTNTSSDTLTANDVRSDASSFALLNDSPTEPGVKADSLHQSSSDVIQHILSTTAHSHNSPDTKAAVSHQASLENTSDTSSHTLSKTECLEPNTSDLPHAAAKVASPIVPPDCVSSSKAESEIGAGDYSANSLLDESISDHSQLDSQEYDTNAALKFSTKVAQSDVGDHKTPVVLAANQADELVAMFSEISLGKSSSSEHVIEETISLPSVNKPDMDLHETSTDLGTVQFPNPAVNVIEGQCGESKSDMSSNFGHESNEVDLHCFDSVKSAPEQDITKKEVSSVVNCVKSLSDFTETEYGSVKKDLAIHGRDLIESSEQSAGINNALKEAEIPLPKGAYTLDFSQMDDPNFDPFKTSTGLNNSPTKTTTPVPEIPSLQSEVSYPSTVLQEKQNLSFEKAKVESVKNKPHKAKSLKTQVKHTGDVINHIADLPDDAQDLLIPKISFDSTSFHSSDSNLLMSSEDRHIPATVKSTVAGQTPDSSFSLNLEIDGVSNDVSCAESERKVTDPQIPNNKEQVLCSEMVEQPSTLGSISVKVSSVSEGETVVSSIDALVSDDISNVQLDQAEDVEAGHAGDFKPDVAKSLATESSISNVADDGDSTEDAIPARGSYSFDFSKFGDPNYDPFKTSHGLSNSETEEIPKASTDSVQPDLSQKDNTPSLSQDQSAKSVSKPKTSESKMPLLKKSAKKAKPVVDNTISNKEADSEVISVPQGAYTMDFGQFDDPNFNPFKTSSGVANSPTGVSPPSNAFSFAPGNEKLSNIEDECLEEAPISGQSFREDESCLGSEQPGTTPSIPAKHDQNLDDAYNPQTPYSVDLKQSDGSAFDEKNLSVERNAPGKPNKQSPSHQRAATKETTVEEEERPPPGAYSFDFSKFDDPNFDPFKTSKGVSNSPTKETREQMLPPVENDASSEKQISVEITDKSSTSLPKSKKASTSKKRAKKPKPWQTIDNDNTGNAENLPVQPGSYSIDFSELDDVNFDPFKTTKAVMNSPTTETSDNSFTVETKTEEPLPEKSTQRAATKTVKVKKRSEKPKPWQSATGEDDAEGSSGIPHQAGTYSIDFSKLDSASDDPFITTNKISNSPTGELVATLTSQTKSNFSSENQDDDTTALPKPSRLVDSKSEEITSAVTPAQMDTSTNDDQVENVDDVPVKPGAYSIDFSNFDDPNFDPFKTSKGLSNSPTKETPPSLDNNDNTEKMPSIPAKRKVQKSSQGSKLKKPGLSKKKAKKPVPVETLDIRAGGDEGNSDSLAKPGAYSLDFSQFSDPSFDPFVSNSGLNNSPTKLQPSDPITGEAAAIDITTADTVVEKSVSIPSPKKSKSSKAKTAKKPKTPPSSLQDTDEDATTRGAYSVDFSKFDDPNYNPFASTSGGLSNSPTRETVAAIAQAPVEKMPPHAQDASSVEKIEANSVLVSKDNSAGTPSAAKPGAGVTDFSKYDDPNFDPFKPSKGLPSSPVDKQFPSVPSSNATSSDDSDAYFDAASHNSSLGSKSAASGIRANELDETLTKTTTQVPENESPNDTFTVDKDVFKSAEEVFGSEAGQSQWDKFWKDEAKGTDIPLDSALRKQSLYVQFDPLLETTRLPEYSHTSRPPAVAVNDETQPTKDAFDFLDHGEPSQVTSDHPSHPQAKKVMTSYEQPQLHPAAARLARNLSDDGRKWNETEVQDGSIGIDLINFSPSSKMRNRTTYSAVKSEVQSGGHRYTQEELDEMAAHDHRVMEQEVAKLRRLRDKLKQDYQERKLEIMWYKESEADMAKNLSEAQSSVEMAKLENERVRGEFLSTKRVFDDYHRRASDLRPVLESHIKADAELRKQYNIRLKVNQMAMQEYLSSKKEAETVKANFEAQLEQARTTASNRRRALEARVKKEQMTVASMETLLKDKIKENEELSKICDELVANAENS